MLFAFFSFSSTSFTHIFSCAGVFLLSVFADREDLYSNSSSMCEYHYNPSSTAKGSGKLLAKNVLFIVVLKELSYINA